MGTVDYDSTDLSDSMTYFAQTVLSGTIATSSNLNWRALGPLATVADAPPTIIEEIRGRLCQWLKPLI